jgi:hypothetical protein
VSPVYMPIGDTLEYARGEFAVTASVPLLFVALTVGLVTLVAITQTRFWGPAGAEWWRSRTTANTLRDSTRSCGWGQSRRTRSWVVCEARDVLGSDLAVIQRYADGLAASLHGPRRLRADMVAEARDSLLDAAMAHLDAGLRPADAVRRAVDEFGDYAEIVPAYQAELAAAQGRRTALWMATVLPVMHLFAPLMWWKAPWTQGDHIVRGYWALTANFDYLSIAATVAAVVLLVGFGWGSRFVRDGVRYSHTVGVGVLVFLVVHGAAGVAVFALSFYQWPQCVTWPPIFIGAVLNLFAFGYAALTAWRCVKASRRDAEVAVATA